MRPWQQERHYMQALILSILSEEPLVFKGGTYLWFFHGLRRFSEDLDFTLSEENLDGLPEETSRGLEFFGVENQFKIINDSEKTFSFRISTKGPLNTGGMDLAIVYVEISKREKIMGKRLPLKFDYPAYQLPIKNISGMNLDEVGAEKVRAIITRKKARDVYDLNYLVKQKGIRFDQKMAEEKLRYYGREFSDKIFLEKLREKEEYYNKELEPIVFDALPKFKEVENSLRKWVGI